MKQLLHFIFYSMIILLTNCKQTVLEDQCIRCYDLSDYKPGKLADIFSDVNFIPFEFAGNEYPEQVLKLCVTDSIIIVTDIKSKIHIFSPDGKYISCSSEKQGEGPGEFPFSMGTTWNVYNNTLEIITPSKLISYDKYFNHIKETKLPAYIDNNGKSILFRYIHSLSDSIHLVRPNAIDRLIYFNSNTLQLGSELPYDEYVICDFNLQRNNFFNIQDSTYFIPNSMTNKIFNFDVEKMTIKPIIEFTTGSNGLTRQYLEDLNMNRIEIAQFMLTCDRNMLLNILPNTNYFLTILDEGYKKNLCTLYYIFIDRTTGDKFRINMYEGNKANMPMFEFIDNEFAYATVLKEELEEMPWLLLDKEEKSDSIFGSIEDESLILLKYRFR